MARMRAIEAAVLVMRREGVDTAFGVPGAAINPMYAALKKIGGIDHVLARHVEGASHMAEGYTRTKAGNIGVCIGTSGPAGTDMITGLYSASADSIPLLCITGQAPRARLHKEDFQAVDISSIAAPVAKWATTVLEPAQVPYVFQKAFQLMRSDRPGPVLIDLPFDVQMAEIEFDIDAYEPLPVSKPKATRVQAEKVLAMLDEAERPLLVAGGGIFNASWQDIVSGLGWGLGYFGMPHILVRFMSIEKPSMIKKSSIVAIIWVVISLFSAVMIAYFGRMIMGEELLTHGNQKLVFIAMSRKFFPAGICGLLLAAIIAASISTADSQLLVASSSFTADLYKPFFRKGASEKETLLIGRVLVLVLSLIAFAIANSKGSGAQAIMDMVENAWGAFGSSFGPTILLSLFWKRFNYKGAVAGVVSGFVVDLGWLLSGLTASTGVYEIVPGFIVSFLAAYLVARFTEAPNAEAVAIFEEATKPDAD